MTISFLGRASRMPAQHVAPSCSQPFGTLKDAAPDCRAAVEVRRHASPQIATSASAMTAALARSAGGAGQPSVWDALVPALS